MTIWSKKTYKLTNVPDFYNKAKIAIVWLNYQTQKKTTTFIMLNLWRYELLFIQQCVHDSVAILSVIRKHFLIFKKFWIFCIRISKKCSIGTTCIVMHVTNLYHTIMCYTIMACHGFMNQFVSILNIFFYEYWIYYIVLKVLSS